jgi:ABC-type hemin transport system ATPase subunit
MEFQELPLLKSRWEALMIQLAEQFGVVPDLQAIIFLIGVQELGRGPQKFSKDEKQDLMHIATCKLLSQYEYYELSGTDQEGWPHWKLVKPLPALSLKEQDILLKQAVLDYFESDQK